MPDPQNALRPSLTDCTDQTGLNWQMEEARWMVNSPAHSLHFKGWVFIADQSSSIRAFHARSGNKLLTECPAGLRPDVRAFFNGHPHAEFVEFDLYLPPINPESPITLLAILANGLQICFLSCLAGDLPGRQPAFRNYPQWTDAEEKEIPRVVDSNTGRLFTVLMPVYNPEPLQLREALDSVLQQLYTEWELLILDDASTSPAIGPILAEYASRDNRIQVEYLSTNGGISRTTNIGLAAAKGEYVVLLDHDDILRPHALSEFNRELLTNPSLDIIYSDEDKLDSAGSRCLPLFKPDFSPEFLKGVMYIGHALCFRTSFAHAVGGFDSRFDGIQDYEFVLRASEHGPRVGHISRILYHWRQSEKSSALHGNVKGNMDELQVIAVRSHLSRLGDLREARPLGGHRVRLLPKTHSGIELIKADRATSALSVIASVARSSTADVLILIRDCSIVDQPDWQQELACLALLPDSAFVGPHILSQEGLIYESGWFIHETGLIRQMSGLDPHTDGYNGTLVCNREVDGISPFCVAVRRSVALAIQIPSSGEWVEACVQLNTLGLRHRICASVKAKTAHAWNEPTASTTVRKSSHEFYNRQFDPKWGDYRLTIKSHPGFTFHLDQPTDWLSTSRCLIIRGWCFVRSRDTIEGLRLRMNDFILPGVALLPRPDVKAAIPEAPDDDTGFEIRGILPVGKNLIHLEAYLSDGSWHEFDQRTIRVNRRLLPLWLGGGDWMELMFFQMPGHMAYPARAIRAEKFPPLSGQPRPKLSIVTPSFNQARFLPETMRSVLEQAGVQCDYVVQDGGSSDGSQALIRRMAEKAEGRMENGNQKADPASSSLHLSSLLPSPGSPRLISWSSEPDGGQADAIVKGFAKTSGGADDVMAWINSDDFYLPGALGFVADYFARHPDVDVVYGHRIVVNEESREIARWFLPKHDPEVLRLNDFVPQETLFWRRRIWDKVGGLDSSFKFAMDWDLLLRFQAAGAKIVRVPYFMACFRVHAAQKTSAQMHSVGQEEITRLRERTHGRPFPPTELETHPRLLRYLRRSAFIEFLWKLGIRARWA